MKVVSEKLSSFAMFCISWSENDSQSTNVASWLPPYFFTVKTSVMKNLGLPTLKVIPLVPLSLMIWILLGKKPMAQIFILNWLWKPLCKSHYDFTYAIYWVCFLICVEYVRIDYSTRYPEQILPWFYQGIVARYREYFLPDILISQDAAWIVQFLSS